MRFDAALVAKYEQKLVPSETALSVVRVWLVKTGGWAWTVVCHCGNAKLLLVGNYGVRCHDCGEYHSRNAYMRASEKARAKANFRDEPIVRTTDIMDAQRKMRAEQIRQPMIMDKNGRLKRLPARMMKAYRLALLRVKPKLTGDLIQHKQKAKLVSASGGVLL